VAWPLQREARRPFYFRVGNKLDPDLYGDKRREIDKENKTLAHISLAK